MEKEFSIYEIATYRLILGGSRVRDDFRPDSDYDFYIIVPDDVQLYVLHPVTGDRYEGWPLGKFMHEGILVTWFCRPAKRHRARIEDRQVDLSFLDVKTGEFHLGVDDEEYKVWSRAKKARQPFPNPRHSH